MRPCGAMFYRCYPATLAASPCGSVATVVVNSGGGAAEGFHRKNGGDGVYFWDLNEVLVYGLVIRGNNPMTNA